MKANSEVKTIISGNGYQVISLKIAETIMELLLVMRRWIIESLNDRYCFTLRHTRYKYNYQQKALIAKPRPFILLEISSLRYCSAVAYDLQLNKQWAKSSVICTLSLNTYGIIDFQINKAIKKLHGIDSVILCNIEWKYTEIILIIFAILK